uniref:Uncharacterized protein n=1 Tax=Schmidtea mediterranea TaxID=79327 RepID=A0A1S6KMI4_SCHMD|nr:hypothetical protein Smed-scnn1 [Schmidtea mediterranea]
MKSGAFVDPVLPVFKCVTYSDGNCRQILKHSRFVMNNKICATVDLQESNTTNNVIHSFSIIYLWMSSTLNTYVSGWPTWDNFVSVYIHGKWQLPSSTTAGYAIPDTTGNAYIYLQKTFINMESTKRNPCLNVADNVEISDFDGQIRSLNYSQQLCKMINIQNQLWDKCQCISSNLLIPGRFSRHLNENQNIFCHHIHSNLLLNMTDFQHLNQLKAKLSCYENVYFNSPVDSCIQYCNNAIYNGNNYFYQFNPPTYEKDIYWSEIPTITEPYIRNYFYYPDCFKTTISAKLNCKIVKSNVLKFHINLIGEIKTFSESSSYSIVNLLSDVGGILGLYGGSGCLTIVEFLEYLAKVPRIIF